MLTAILQCSIKDGLNSTWVIRGVRIIVSPVGIVGPTHVSKDVCEVFKITIINLGWEGFSSVS